MLGSRYRSTLYTRSRYSTSLLRKLLKVSRRPVSVCRRTCEVDGVTAKMTGDRGDRPALLAERGCLHVFLPCQHGPGSSPVRWLTHHQRPGGAHSLWRTI